LSPTATPLTWLALRAIALYQRHLSPRKGYRCALHAAGLGRNCSAYGYRAIARGGVMKGLVLLRRRFAACGRVHAAARPAVRYQPGMAYQRGFCDAGCDIGGCDIGDFCAADCCSDGCDWRWKRRKAWPEANPDDHLNNENRLRERIRQAREQARQNR
jgi:putative component of membrane protein insertase Oxa1/YidC/SpoIIIJ protein YidD